MKAPAASPLPAEYPIPVAAPNSGSSVHTAGSSAAGGPAAAGQSSAAALTPPPLNSCFTARISPGEDEVRVAVTCGSLAGMMLLPKRIMLVGAGTPQAKEVSPTEFERLGGKGCNKRWKSSIQLANGSCCIGDWLRQHGYEEKGLTRTSDAAAAAAADPPDAHSPAHAAPDYQQQPSLGCLQSFMSSGCGTSSKMAVALAPLLGPSAVSPTAVLPATVITTSTGPALFIGSKQRMVSPDQERRVVLLQAMLDQLKQQREAAERIRRQLLGATQQPSQERQLQQLMTQQSLTRPTPLKRSHASLCDWQQPQPQLSQFRSMGETSSLPALPLAPTTAPAALGLTGQGPEPLPGDESEAVAAMADHLAGLAPLPPAHLLPFSSPTLNGRQVDLRAMFHAVVARGGYQAVTNGGRWEGVLCTLGLLAMQDELGALITQATELYANLLLRFERMYNIELWMKVTGRPVSFCSTEVDGP